MKPQCRMATSLLVILCFGPCLFANGDAADGANPIQKTVELLTKLQESIIADAENEEKAYKEYYEWCDDAAHEKAYEIQDATKQKEKLEAVIEEAASEIEEYTSQIEDLAAGNAKSEADLKDATTVRGKEQEDFQASEKELIEAIDMLDRAINLLEREAKGTALVQSSQDTADLQTVLFGLTSVVDAAGFAGEQDKQKLLSFIQNAVDAQQNDADASDAKQDPGAPAAAAYENHSGNIVQVMQDLRDKAEAQLQSERKDESTTQHNYAMLKQSLEDSLENSDKQLNAKKNAKAGSMETKATAEGDLSVTVRELAAAKEAMSSIQEKCMETANDHEITVKGHKQELKTLAETKKLIQSTTGGAQEVAYSFTQLSSSSSSIFGTQSNNMKIKGKQVTNILLGLAQEQHSAELSEFASRVAAVIQYGAASGEDPFKKVKGLIMDLIARLEKEAAEDATEKAYCDKEMADTEKKHGELTDEVNDLKSKIEKATTESTTLKSEVKDLQHDLATIKKLQQKLDHQRAFSHKVYLETKADLEQGLDGIRGAIKILSDYYSKDSEDSGSTEAALLQTGNGDAMGDMMSQPDLPVKFKKSTGAAGSILALLEVCESDLAKNLAECETEEADAQAQYEKQTQESKVTQTMKEQDVTYKTKEFKGLDKQVADLSTDLGTSSAELQAVTEYFAKVKDRCIAKPELYEVRKARREAEIKGLKEAQAILQADGGSSFLQRHRW